MGARQQLTSFACGLWSLWDIMQKLKTERLFKPYEQTSTFHQMLATIPSGQHVELSPDDLDHFMKRLSDLIEELNSIEMSTTALPLSRALEELRAAQRLPNGRVYLSPGVVPRIKNELAQGTSRIADDFSAMSLLALQPSMRRYYDNPKLFGQEVFDCFPSANNDIAEAGICLALGRGTACVMHSMRVVEAGLKCLAGALGIAAQGDWGAYLREIDKSLDARIKASGKRTEDEQFYAEARVTIDGVRLAWRNPTMHIENNYSPDRAEEILLSVRSLMRHLSSRLSEPDSLGRLLY